jgi:hypothetical protein
VSSCAVVMAPDKPSHKTLKAARQDTLGRTLE